MFDYPVQALRSELGEIIDSIASDVIYDRMKLQSSDELSKGYLKMEIHRRFLERLDVHQHVRQPRTWPPEV